MNNCDLCFTLDEQLSHKHTRLQSSLLSVNLLQPRFAYTQKGDAQISMNRTLDAHVTTSWRKKIISITESSLMH